MKSCGGHMALLLAALPLVNALPREIGREVDRNLGAPNWWLVIGALVLLLLVIVWFVDHHDEPAEPGDPQP